MPNHTKNYTKKPLFIITFLLWTAYGMAQVGIGTVTPHTSAALDVTSTTKGLLIPRLSNTQATTLSGTTPAQGMLIYNTDRKCIQIYSGTSFQCLITDNASDTTNDAWVNDSANNMVKLGTNSNGNTARPDSTNLVIKDDGKVGIGISNPQGALHVNTTNSSDIIFSKASSTASEDMDIDIVRLKGSGSNFFVPDSGYSIGGLRYKSYTGSAGVFNVNAEISTLADGTITSSSNPGSMIFKTTPVGSLSPSTRIIIKNDGKVGIGTTTPNANAVLDIVSTSKGILLPRIALDTFTLPKPLASATDGMLVYSEGGKSLPDGFYYWESGRWHNVGEKAKVLHSVTSAGGTNSATSGTGSVTVPANTDRLVVADGNYAGTVTLPTAANSNAANRINDVISIVRTSSYPITISSTNTDMSASLSISSNHQTAYFMFDGFKWVFIKQSN